MKLCFTDEAWEDYLYWQGQDKKILKRINKIIKDIQSHSFEGIAKPELPKYDYQGSWSRRIDAENRLINIVEDEIL